MISATSSGFRATAVALLIAQRNCSSLVMFFQFSGLVLAPKATIWPRGIHFDGITLIDASRSVEFATGTLVTSPLLTENLCGTRNDLETEIVKHRVAVLSLTYREH